MQCQQVLVAKFFRGARQTNVSAYAVVIKQNLLSAAAIGYADKRGDQGGWPLRRQNYIGVVRDQLNSFALLLLFLLLEF